MAALPQADTHGGRSGTHLLLVNLGTPREASAESVREFLLEFLSDPAVVDIPQWIWQPVLRGIVLRRRPARIARAYRSIWGRDGSPLRVATERMVKAARLVAPGAVTASAAYRYGEPSLDAELRRLSTTAIGRIVVVPLFPQRTDATSGTIVRLLHDAAARTGIASRVEARALAPDDDGYIASLAARWFEALDAAPHPPGHLVVSFHGIPVRFDRREQRQYSIDCETTTRALLRAIEWPESRTTLAYQSKFGPEPWLTPATAAVINDLPKRGIRRVAVITPGFLTDGLETLEEIGIRAREDFVANGGEVFIRVGAVEGHHALVSALARLVTAGPVGTSPTGSSGVAGKSSTMTKL